MTYSHSTGSPVCRVYKSDGLLDAIQFVALFGGHIVRRRQTVNAGSIQVFDDFTYLALPNAAAVIRKKQVDGAAHARAAKAEKAEMKVNETAAAGGVKFFVLFLDGE
jgi:ATP-dependent Clp protease adapter protein ClpS